jgi:hypothetical protein
MKRRSFSAVRFSPSPGRIVVAVLLALGGAPAFAAAPLSIATSDAPAERSGTQNVMDAGTASGHPSNDPTASREAAVADSDNTAATTVVTGPVGSVEWWIGFSDSTLNLLEQMAQDRSHRPVLERSSAARGVNVVAPVSGEQQRRDEDDVAVSLASAYVQARVLRIRLATAQALTMIARRQTEQSSNRAAPLDGSEPAAAQRALAMAERAHSAAADFEASLERCVSEIAALTGMEPTQARKLLEPSFSSSQLPVFGVAVPPRLPAQVVRGRSDVRSLEASLLRDRGRMGGQYPVAEFAAALGGWIEPHGDASADTARKDPVGRAKAEVGSALYRLVRQQQAAAMNYQISQVRRTEFETVLQRKGLCEASDAEVLEKHLLLLVENDRLAAAVGAIAASWIALNAATGGQAAVAASGQLKQAQSAGSTQGP